MIILLGTWHGLNIRDINFDDPMTFHVILKPFTLIPKDSNTEPKPKISGVIENQCKNLIRETKKKVNLQNRNITSQAHFQQYKHLCLEPSHPRLYLRTFGQKKQREKTVRYEATESR